MKVYAPAAARTTPVDRNVLRILTGSSGGQAGGGNLQIGSYTCPTGRRAAVYVPDYYGIVTTVMGAGQIGELRVNRNAVLVYTRRWLGGDAVGSEKALQTLPMFLIAGDNVTLLLAMAAGAGVVFGCGAIEGYEYDV